MRAVRFVEFSADELGCWWSWGSVGWDGCAGGWGTGAGVWRGKREEHKQLTLRSLKAKLILSTAMIWKPLKASLHT